MVDDVAKRRTQFADDRPLEGMKHHPPNADRNRHRTRM